MQAQALKAAGASEGAYSRVGSQLTGIRNNYLDNIKASSAFDVRQTQSISQTEAYTKALKDQKVHAMDAWRNRKLMNSVIKEQIDLQRAQAVSWRKDGQGRVLSDLIIPRDAVKGWKSARVTLGAYNEVLRSVADQTVKMGKNTQWAGRQLMVGFTVPLAIVAAATGKMAYDMDKALTSITKVYGDATQAIQDDSDTIRSAAMQTANNMAHIFGQSAKDTLEIESQFAAAGKTGAELQQATAEATKARMLNEMDLQTAIKASITMQTVYGYTAEELGQKWEYINAVANQTVLGAEDFATAIPKVAGITKELGGTIEDLGVLMTAFKAAGIDAAEGANALKTISFRAVSAYGKGLDTFKKMTGKDLQEIINQTNGETIPTLMKLYEAMENLNTPQKVAVVKDVFGIYQGNKALILMEQLAEQSGQVAQAMAVGKNSIAENSAIANQELARMNAQPYKKIEKAIQSIKIEMAELGQVVLPMASGILNAVSGLMDFVNGMSGGSKKLFLIAAAAVAIIGPFTMLLGLFGNLFGNIMKLQAAFGGLITRFKFTDAAERAQILVGKQATSVWDTQTRAVSMLTLELQKLNEVFATTTALQHRAAAAPVAPMGTMAGAYTIRKDSKGRTQIRDVNNQNRQISAARYAQLQKEAQALGGVERAEHARAAALAETNKQQAALAKKQQGRIAGAGGGAAMAGLMLTMFGGNSPILHNLGNALFLMGSIMAIAPKFIHTIGQALVLPFQMMGEVAGPAIAKAKAGMSGLATYLKALGKALVAPMAIAAVAIVIYWQRVKQSADEANEKAKDYINTAKALAEMSGVNWQDATGVPDVNMTGEQRFTDRGETFRKKYEKEFAAIKEQYASLTKGMTDDSEKMGELWGIAIAKGVEVRLHGGTEQAAKDATRTVLASMNKDFSDETFEVEINARMNFDNPDNLVNAQLETIKQTMRTALNDIGTDNERYNRDHGFLGLFASGQDDLTQAAHTTATKAGEEFFNALKSVNTPQRRKEVYDQFLQDNVSEMENLFKKMKAKGGHLTDNMSFSDFISNKDNITKGLLGPKMGMNDQEVDATMKKLDAVRTVLQGIASQAGASASQVSQVFSPEDLDQYIASLFKIGPAVETAFAGWDRQDFADMHEEYAAMQEKAAQSGKKLSDVELLKMLNIVRTNHHMSKATSLTEGFNAAQIDAADSGKTLAEVLKDIGSAMTEDEAIAAYRGVIEATTQASADYAMDLYDKHADARMQAYDDEADRVDKSFDHREKAMDDKYDARTERLKKKQDDRRKGIEDYYDARIKKIDDTIEAEKKADDERQRIFEAEKERMRRMSELYNKNVDLNSAISTGNFDEAAKIANDMAASTQQWSADDSNARAGDASQKRQDALGKQKDALEERKKARLDALKAVEDAEDKALEKDKERAKERLAAAKDAAKKEVEARKAAAQQTLDINKTKLQQELDLIRASVPRNKKEMDKQIAQMKVAYETYGGELKGKGNEWTKYVGDQMVYQQKLSAARIKNELNWKDIGGTIANGILKGGLGMSPAQFTSWLNGGQAPKGSVFAPKAKERIAGENSPGGITRHKGGIIDDSKGSRAGYSGKGLSQSEVMVRALKGESVLNRHATKALGSDNIDAINSGKLPKDTGPWSMGAAGGMGAAIMSGAMKRMFSETFNAVVRMKSDSSGQVSGKPGDYANVKLTQEQINNAMTIADVGKSMGASKRDQTIALMTAMQESSLRNLHGGDRDSAGLFQQRPSQGWGSFEQVTNPRYAAKKFYETLFKVKDRNQMSMSAAAQKVQRSAYPDAYARWQQMATALLGKGSTTGFGAGINMAQYMNGGNGAGVSQLMPGGWYRPTKGGKVTSEYGMRYHPIDKEWRLHGGIDLGVPVGTPVFAAHAGMVSRASWEKSRGNFTKIDHGGGIQTGYAHQSKMLVKPEQMVKAGQQIGLSGNTGASTGPHLHFEYYKDGQRLNPRMIIPKFENGAYTLSGGLAELHPRETVLSEPLSDNLHKGLNQFANGEGARYDITMDFRGAHINSEVDIQRGVEKAITTVERRRGVNRKIGDK
jgi:TP901 family phage tail tape measure protein